MEGQQPLSAEELLHFKREGFVLRRGLLPPARCAEVRDALWEHGHHHMWRDDPDTWVGPMPYWEARDGGGGGGHLGDHGDTPEGWPDTRVEFFWGCRAIQRPLVGLIRNTAVWSIMSQLLGEGQLIEPQVGAPWRTDPIDGELRMWAPERVRGLLCNLPHPPGTHESADSIAAAAHADMMPFHLGVTALVDRCPPGGGGFTVWPRSHLRLFRADQRFGDVVSCADRGGVAGAVGGRVDGGCHPVLQPAYAAVQRTVQETLSPLEFHGGEGDVMFWHSHMFHARPENHSSPPQIRQAVIYDCAKRSIDNPHRPRALAVDPWHEWAECVRDLIAEEGSSEGGAAAEPCKADAARL